VLAGVVEMRGT